MKNNKIFVSLFLIFFASCDFVPSLHKDVLKAGQLVKNKEYNKAIGYYQSALSRKPSQEIWLKINYQLGQIHSIYLNDYKKSLTYYKNILNIPSIPFWHVKSLERLAAITSENLHDYQSSVDYLVKLTAFEPKLEKHQSYQFKLAKAYFSLRNYKQAQDIFNTFIVDTANEHYVDSYYYIALISYYKKNWADAIKKLEFYLKIEKSKNKIVYAKYLIANSYEMKEDLQSAYNIYYSILNTYPNPEVIKQRLNSLYERRLARKR